MFIVKLIFNLYRKVSDISFYYIFGSIKFARMKGVRIGNDCRIYIMNWGTEPFLISLGDNVTVTSGVKFITHDGSTCLILDEQNNRFQKYGCIEVGSNVFIGVNSIILPNVKIGSNVIIGAGSVVNKDLECGYVYAGVPAKKICTFKSYHNKISHSCASNTMLKDVRDYKQKVYRALDLQDGKKK